MDKLEIVEQIQKSNELLSMPQAISEILREMEKPDYSADALGSIILKDASLTTRILKLANSPFYHRFSEIKNVNQAIAVLGSTTVKCLALSSSVFNAELIQENTGIDVKNFFGSVLSVASAAQRIAREADYKASDEAFIAGLLHHIGIMFLVHHYPKEYKKVVSRQVKARTLAEAEQEVFGLDHSEVGYQLSIRWNLPEYVCDAIRGHHEFVNLKTKTSMPNIIRLATVLVEDPIGGYAADLEERVTNVTRAREALRLSREQVDEITASMTSDAFDVAKYLNIDIGDVEEILVRANKEIWKTYLMVEHLFKERQELSAQLLREEREKGAIRSKNVAIATMSHYLNNATMAISGRAQIMQRQLQKDDREGLLAKLPQSLEVIERSINKIRAVLEEIKDISPIDEVEYYDMSQAMNLDERIATRMSKLSEDTGLVLPESADSR